MEVNLAVKDGFKTPLYFWNYFANGGVVPKGRTLALGKTNVSRHLSVIFPISNKLIRPISARDMSRKEREVYEKTAKENTEL